jgi:glycosyltransferase involved in cell wall biosynthesis
MQKNQPLVSVLVPCYNVSSFVEKAVNSILSQTYTNLEIWIIDDASADDTLQKIQAFKDHRIKVIAFKENTKKVGAVNEVLQEVNGDYIAFQDADDWSEPTRIREQVEQFIRDSELGICFTNYRYIGAKIFLPGKISLTNEELREEFLNFTYEKSSGFSPTNCPTMMISKTALQKTKGYDPYFAGRVAEDIQWVYRILKNFKGITIDKILYNYTIREGSFTQIQSKGKNPKYAYSWQLLSKIIYKDIHEAINVLEPGNIQLLKKLELEACEDALIENIQLLKQTIAIYENSASFKLGKFLLTPWRVLKARRKN